MAEVVEFLRNPVECAKMIALAYAEVCESDSYSYREFISRFDHFAAALATPERRSSVPSFTRKEMDEVKPFYFIQYPYSLATPLSRRFPRNPIKLLRQLVAPMPGQLGLKDIIRRIGRLG